MAFIQLPKELIKYIPPSGLLAYAIVADKCRLKDRSCYISQKSMGEQLHLSERSVRKMLKTLEYLRLIKFDGYSSAGTSRYVCPELTSELISDVQWKLTGGRWETISDVANNEIRGHKRGTSETISDVDGKLFPPNKNERIKRQNSGLDKKENPTPTPLEQMSEKEQSEARANDYIERLRLEKLKLEVA
jgi:hypothetical protein